jgi:NAD(P)-dependent dehydrogenase (short-subunit alcohol dehydrogenase family)
MRRWRRTCADVLLTQAVLLPSSAPASRTRALCQFRIRTARFAQDSVYCASKWGLAGFADALEENCARLGARHKPLPGATDTDLPSTSWSPKDDPRRPFFLAPEDVARAAMFALDQPAHVAISRIVLRPMIEPPYSDFLPIPSGSKPNAESPSPSEA